MDKPVISDSFTIEDIHLIREWHYKKRNLLGEEEYNKALKASVALFLKDMPKAKQTSTPNKSY